MTAGRRVFAPLSREARTFFGPPHPHSVIPADLTGDTGRHVRSGGLKCNAAPDRVGGVSRGAVLGTVVLTQRRNEWSN